MKTATVAFLHPTESLTGDDRSLREQLWAKTTELLTPELGKLYQRFEPAVKAWGESVNKPFGVVLGRSDSKTFLVLYAKAHEQQEAAVKFHMSGFLGGFDVGEQFNEGSLHGFTMNPKANAGEAISGHLTWHLGMMAGKPFPDAGIYYVPARQAVISEVLEQQILCSIGSYALCMVSFYAGDGDV